MNRAKQAVDAYGADWNAHDLAALKATTTPDFVFDDKTMAEPLSGIEAVAGEALAAFPDFRLSIRSQTELGEDGLLAEWTMDATHRADFMGIPATGNSFRLRGSVPSWSAKAGWRRRRCTTTARRCCGPWAS